MRIIMRNKAGMISGKGLKIRLEHDKNKNIMSELDIRKWLSTLSESVQERDLEKHMALISKNIAVYGMPNGQVLNYNDWQSRRKNEFERGILKNLSYDKLQVKTFGLRRLIFEVEEIMDASNGDMAIINKQIILEQEDDNQWRAVEETIQNWKFLKAKQVNGEQA